MGWIAGAVLASGVGSLFAAGDSALTSMPGAHLQMLGQEKGSAFARFVQDPERILSRWLVCRVVAIAIAAALFDEAANQMGSDPRLGPVLAVVGAVLTYGTFAELLGSLGRQRPEQIGAAALRFLLPLELATMPVAAPLAWLGRFVQRHVPKRHTHDARITETEVEWLVNEGERAGALANEPAQIIRNALEFSDLTAREVMVPRRKISAVEQSTPLSRVLELAASDGHSRYPVYREQLDQIVGLLYAKDLFRKVREGTLSGKALDMVRTPVLFVSESQTIATILKEMRARRLHLAIVSDEFGGTAGVITLEDILEEIVGDIRDEYDTETQIEEVGDGHVLADAAVSIADLSAYLKRDIPADGDFESLGGLLVHQAGHVPRTGDVMQLDGLKFIVREADETRVVKVEIVAERAVA